MGASHGVCYLGYYSSFQSLNLVLYHSKTYPPAMPEDFHFISCGNSYEDQRLRSWTVDVSQKNGNKRETS